MQSSYCFPCLLLLCTFIQKKPFISTSKVSMKYEHISDISLQTLPFFFHQNAFIRILSILVSVFKCFFAQGHNKSGYSGNISRNQVFCEYKINGSSLLHIHEQSICLIYVMYEHYILREKSLANFLRLWFSFTNHCHKNISVLNNCDHLLTA